MAQMHVSLLQQHFNPGAQAMPFNLPVTPDSPGRSAYDSPPKRFMLLDPMTNHSYEVVGEYPADARSCNSSMPKQMVDFNALAYGAMDLPARFPYPEIANSLQPAGDFESFGALGSTTASHGSGMNMYPYFRTPHINRNETFSIPASLDAYVPDVCASTGSESHNVYSALDAFEQKLASGYRQNSLASFGKLCRSDVSDRGCRLKSESDIHSYYVNHNSSYIPSPTEEVFQGDLIQQLTPQSNPKVHALRPTAIASSSSIGREQDVEQVDDDRKCKNTVEGTKTSVRRFKRWYKEKCCKDLDMNSVNRFNAPEMLKEFFLDIRDTRPGRVGNEYEPVTLTTYRNGLRRYFLYRKVPPAPDNFDLTDKSFDVVNRLLVTKRDDLKRKGKGNHPNAIESITSEQLEKMWASGAIGVHGPRPLLRLMWWYNTVYHGIRGRMAHHDLNMEDFVASRGIDGKISLEHCKHVLTGHDLVNAKLGLQRKKKSRGRVSETDGSDRDPVHAFEVFRAHRPPGISSFYLTPKLKPKGHVWFNKVPMGKNSIGRIMREIKSISGIG